MYLTSEYFTIYLLRSMIFYCRCSNLSGSVKDVVVSFAWRCYQRSQ